MEKYQGDLKIEDLHIGMKLIRLTNNQESTITNLTITSVEVFNTADQRFKDKDGKLKGINCTNWYELSWFNRKFKS